MDFHLWSPEIRTDKTLLSSRGVPDWEETRRTEIRVLTLWGGTVFRVLRSVVNVNVFFFF